jgi:site-specific DNA recombinase
MSTSGRAAIYTRQSLDKTGEAVGVTHQLDECRELAKRKRYEVVSELSDNDISATTGKRRPNFERLLDLISAGAVDTVVVWHPDRLYRKLTDLVKITEIAKEHGLTIASVQSGEVDLSTPSGRMTASILGSVATHEGEHRTERQKSAYKALAGNGNWHFSRRPFGYERLGKEAAGKIVQIRSEIEVLRDVLDRYYKSGQSRHSLVKYLNDEVGVLTPQGKPWGIIQLRDMLANSHYAGIVTYRGEEVDAKPSWEPVIDADMWRRWQTKTAKRRRASTFTPAKHLLSGIARCGVCGGVCYARASSAGRLGYTCHDHHCVQRSAAKVDALIEAVVLARLQLPDAVEALRPKPAPTGALLAERDDLTSRIDDLAELVADRTFSAQAARDAAKPLHTRRDALDATLAAQTGAEDLPLDLLAGNVAERWQSDLTLAQKRTLIRTLMTVKIDRQTSTDSRKFDPEDVVIEWITP